MKVLVHRQPVIQDTGGPQNSRQITRVPAPLQSRELDFRIVGALCEVNFGMGDWRPFRLSTGRATTASMLDWHIEPTQLGALRAEAKRLRKAING